MEQKVTPIITVVATNDSQAKMAVGTCHCN